MTLYYAKPLRRATIEDGIFRYEFGERAPVAAGIYRVCGGLCWPDPAAEGYGAALVLGLPSPKPTEKLPRLRAIVLAEHRFLTIEATTQGGVIHEAADLADFMNRAWADYGCRMWYWSGREEDYLVWLRRVIMAPTIQPKPMLPQVDWIDEHSGPALVNEWDETGRLEYVHMDDKGMVHRSIQEAQADHAAYSPWLRALAAALAALDMEGVKRPKVSPRAEDARTGSFAGLV
jgi:hypothetical protein